MDSDFAQCRRDTKTPEIAIIPRFLRQTTNSTRKMTVQSVAATPCFPDFTGSDRKIGQDGPKSADVDEKRVKFLLGKELGQLSITLF
jgi:hypothetical protein